MIEFNQEEENKNLNEFESNNEINIEKLDIEENEDEQEVEEIEEDSIPLVDENKLPPFFRDIWDVTEENEKLAVLVSALTVMSSILPNVYGIYNGKKVYPNIYFYLIGKAGSGKSSIEATKKLVTKIDVQKRTQESNTNFNEGALLNVIISEKLKNENPITLPANNSAAGFIELFNNNNGVGLMFETEGDTLGGMLSKEYGDYSDMLRKAFHHEEISQYRKTENKRIIINEPKLSVVISSTPKQLNRIIPSAENGLFSRFAFLEIEGDDIFKDVFNNTYNNSEKVYSKLSDQSANLYYLLKNIKEPINIILTVEQKERFLNYFKIIKSTIIHFIDEDLDATVNRIGLITYRICQILTMARHIKNDLVESEILCSDDDFDIAITLSLHFIKCSEKTLQLIKKTKNEFTGRNRLFFEALPNGEFTTAQAKSIGANHGISARQIDRLLQSDSFKNISRGIWQKNNDL